MRYKKTQLILIITIPILFFLAVFGNCALFENEFMVFMRPYSLSMVGEAFNGPWIQEGIKDNIRHYYRPFAIVFYATLYACFGTDTEMIYQARLLFSCLKIFLVVCILFYMTGRSPYLALFAGLIYSISFKLFDETIVFSCFPDLVVTTIMYASVLLYILLSQNHHTAIQRFFLGSGVVLLYIIGLGFKENALLLFPTLVLYNVVFIVPEALKAGAKDLRTVFCFQDRMLFCSMAVVLLVYLLARYNALGFDYLFTNSYDKDNNPAWIVFINTINNFSLVPSLYIQQHSFSFQWSVLFKTGINVFFAVAALLLTFNKNTERNDKKAILFAVFLILINTFIYSEHIRVRFNSVGSLGFVIALVFVVKIGMGYVKKTKGTVFLKIVFAVLGIWLFSVYASTNINNILCRDSGVSVHSENRAGLR